MNINMNVIGVYRKVHHAHVCRERMYRLPEKKKNPENEKETSAL